MLRLHLQSAMKKETVVEKMLFQEHLTKAAAAAAVAVGKLAVAGKLIVAEALAGTGRLAVAGRTAGTDRLAVVARWAGSSGSLAQTAAALY